MSSPTRPINEIISAQVAALSEIDTILTTEEEALRARDPELLLAAAEHKTAVLAELRDLEAQRQALSTELSGKQTDVLKEILNRCKAHNMANASLLNAQQQHVDRLLRLVRGDVGPATAYGTNGKRTTNTRPSTTLRSA